MAFTSSPEKMTPSARYFLLGKLIQVALLGGTFAKLADMRQQPVHLRIGQGCSPRRHQWLLANSRAAVLDNSSDIVIGTLFHIRGNGKVARVRGKSLGDVDLFAISLFTVALCTVKIVYLLGVVCRLRRTSHAQNQAKHHGSHYCKSRHESIPPLIRFYHSKVAMCAARPSISFGLSALAKSGISRTGLKVLTSVK